MKLSTLIQLMFLLILVIGVYLLFSNRVQGKMKIVLIAFCFVIGSYLFFKLPMFKDYNEILSSPEKATDINYITKDSIKKTDGPLGISTWVYIDDWNVSYGTEKIIIQPENEIDNFPMMKLDAYKNDLIVSVNIVDDGSSSNSPKKDIIIENINIQKWVNILVTFNNRTLDVYINGKLVKSNPFNNIIMSEHQGGIEVGNEQGFGGFIAKTQYYPYFITPAKAWKIYRGGFGDIFATALNKYNLSVTFYEDNVERNKFSVF